jgi:hypothetical protein
MAAVAIAKLEYLECAREYQCMTWDFGWISAYAVFHSAGYVQGAT